MSTLFNTALGKLEHAVSSGYAGMITAFRELNPLPRNIDKAGFTRLFALMTELATFKSPQSQPLSYDYSTDSHIRACAGAVIEKVLYHRSATGAETLPELPFSAQELRAQLAPWLSVVLSNDGSSDHTIYHALKSGRPVTQELFLQLSLEREEQRKRSKGYTEDMLQAIDIERQTLDLRPWNEVRDRLLPLLDHAHFMIRAASAKKLGEYLAIAYTYQGETDIPAPAQMLRFIADKEIANNNVAGGFIEGLCDTGLFMLSNQDDEVGCALAAEGFDVRQWALSLTLERDSSVPDAPNCMPWWFPVHEFFSHDPDAVQQMYEAGHRWLAMMTALEDAPKEMMRIIERLAQDPDPRISAPARGHMAKSVKA